MLYYTFFNHKMTILEVNILFVLLNLSIFVNLTTAAELGESACRYYGGNDPDDKLCHKDAVKVDSLPVECTSYVFEGVTCNADLEIVPTYGEEDLEILRLLVEIKPKNVFLFYQRRDPDEWLDALYTGDPSAEAQKVKEFVDKYPVGGLILYELEVPFISNDGDFYQKLSAYVTAFKTTNPDLKIGFYLLARGMIFYSNDSTWFDFSKMNDVLDFYVIEFSDFNECIDDLLHGGITPLESKNPEVNTLTKFAAALNASTIAKDKVYFEYLVTPKLKYENQESFLSCESSYMEYCENDYAKIWCIDNENTFYEKGQFAKQYAKGFIAREIDLIDRDLKCNCHEDQYISFHMVLNGYKGAEKITCDRLKC